APAARSDEDEWLRHAADQSARRDRAGSDDCRRMGGGPAGRRGCAGQGVARESVIGFRGAGFSNRATLRRTTKGACAVVEASKSRLADVEKSISFPLGAMSPLWLAFA